MSFLQVCAYLHLDVPDPVVKEWDSDPWILTNTNNRFHGNGAACGKGPLMAWLHAVQAFKQSKTPLPVNIKFIMESMNHQNSEKLADFVATRSQDFFAAVDLVVECDSEWLGSKFPCIIYGTVGKFMILILFLSLLYTSQADEEFLNTHQIVNMVDFKYFFDIPMNQIFYVN